MNLYTLAWDFLKNNLSHALVALLSCFVLWLYADTVLDDALSADEAAGIWLLSFAASYAASRLYRWLRARVVLAIVAGLWLFPQHAVAQPSVVEVPGDSGRFVFSLAENSVFQFPFPLNELSLQGYSVNRKFVKEPPQDPATINCIHYTSKVHEQYLEFCDYGIAFSTPVSSVIVGSDGHTAYAFDLYDLQSGGGGNYPNLRQVPGTRLRNYLEDTGIEIELLSRAALPVNYTDYSSEYEGFGFYGFIVFRDAGAVSKAQKAAVTDAFVSLFEDVYDVGAFNIPRKRMGLLLYPVYLDEVELYDWNDLPDWTLLDEYAYHAANTIIRSIYEQEERSLPSVSIVFVPGSAQRLPFRLEDIDWSESFLFDLSAVPPAETEEFMNYIRLSLLQTGPDDANSSSGAWEIFSRLREIAGSTGRFARLVVSIGSAAARP